MLIDALRVVRKQSDTEWPYSVPAIAHLAQHGIQFESRIGILCGENGSGKSTIIEAIAEAYGLDVRGGHGGRKYGSAETRSRLGDEIKLVRTKGSIRRHAEKTNGFFLRAETAAGMLAFMSELQIEGYGSRSTTQMSHGESYLQAILGRFSGPGLYLLDEAEGPLSFHSTLALLLRLFELAKRSDTQIIYASHSPMVAALPGAQIIQLTESGIESSAWDRLDSVQLWRSFLSRPERFFGL